MAPRVFVDASAYVALARLDDENHQAAVAIIAALQRQRARSYTTYFAVAEAHALLLRYLGIQPAQRYLQELDASRVTTVVHADPADIEAAKALLYRYADKDFSLADTISFVIMTRLGLKIAFAFDKHFGQYGWQILEPERDK
jgi:predicted nucleic acid-binding protein